MSLSVNHDIHLTVAIISPIPREPPVTKTTYHGFLIYIVDTTNNKYEYLPFPPR